MSYGKKKEDEDSDNDENEVAIALVAECQVGEKSYRAGETWNDETDQCRMSICNPGGIISYLECPRFDTEDSDKSCIRIPGDTKYAYPHCCDYVFRTKEKKQSPDTPANPDNEVEVSDDNPCEPDNDAEVSLDTPANPDNDAEVSLDTPANPDNDAEASADTPCDPDNDAEVSLDTPADPDDDAEVSASP